MPDTPNSARLTPDRWRRIGVVLDRVHDAAPELLDAALLEACREQGLAPEDVYPFLEVGQHADALPESLPPELVARAFAGLSDDAHGFRLTAGQTLGPYQIVSPLGAGGMGEAYRARDTRLDRTVAVKVLRPHLLKSDAARQRFDHEARAIARLNHPHVCTLHDVGHHDGIDFFVMEFVDGETLADRLRRGALPAAEAVRYGSQIAGALDRAHRQGIVHRDLKPDNIMLIRGGVKLLDFGLARIETSLMPEEGAGRLMGTPQYMSPELLAGAPADARSDIFACGAVLYEMLTARRAFAGASQAAIVTAIRDHDPSPVSQLIGGTPAALDWTLAKCLAKDPDDRWQSAADLKHHLEWLATSQESPQPVARPRQVWLAAVVSLAVVVAALAMWAWRQPASPAVPAAPIVFAIEPPSGTTFELTHALSPDGRRIAFTAERDGTNELWIRSLDSLTAQRITGSEGAASPFWSPDGRFVAFFAARELKRVDLASGAIQVICNAGAAGGGTWNADDVIVFSPGSGAATGLWRVQASGGVATQITTPDAGLNIHGWPQFLPDGRRFLYMRAGAADPGVYVGDLDPAVAHRPVLAPSPPVPTQARLAGDVLFFLDQATLMAQRFDVARLVPAGERIRVADNVEVRSPGGAAFDVSSHGVVSYREPPAARSTQLTWLARNGRQIAPLGEPAPYMAVVLSRDGQSALNWWQLHGRASGGVITRIDIGSGATTPLFTNAASPVWSPDGSRVAFTRFGDARGPTSIVATLDGRAPERPLAEFGAQAFATDWSADGRFIVGSSLHADTAADIWLADPEGVEPLRYLVREPRHQLEARISPDGRWFAYSATDGQGAFDVYVRSFPDGGRLQRVSVRGGRSPRWRGDGRELYYVEPGGRLMRVPVSSGRSFSSQPPAVLFEHASLSQEPTARFAGYAYDVSPDGTRFLVSIPSAEAVPPTPIVVLLDWALPTGR